MPAMFFRAFRQSHKSPSQIDGRQIAQTRILNGLCPLYMSSVLRNVKSEEPECYYFMIIISCCRPRLSSLVSLFRTLGSWSVELTRSITLTLINVTVK